MDVSSRGLWMNSSRWCTSNAEQNKHDILAHEEKRDCRFIKTIVIRHLQMLREAIQEYVTIRF